MAIQNRLMTRHEHFAQYGSDFDEAMDTIEFEEKRLAAMPQASPTMTVEKSGLAGQESENAVD